MEIKKIDDELSVAPQIVASDIPAIFAAGFKTIVCNRPDGEAEDQQAYVEIEAAAQVAGLSIIYQPVDGRNVTDEDGARFGQLLETVPSPVLAYCRTGTRCTVLWCLSRTGKMPVKDIVDAAAIAGYDVSGITERL